MLNKLEPGSTIAVEPAAEPGVIGNTLDHMSDAVKRVFFGKGSDSLQVEGQDDLLVYRARCCNPIRGEEIIGYVTRGKGVAVHARSCPNVQNLLYESDRRIQVEWAPIASDSQHRGAPKPQTYPVKLTILCDDRAGLLKEFTAIISDDGTNIRSSASSANARRRRHHRLRHRDRRRPPPQSPRRQTAPRPGRARRPARPEDLALRAGRIRSD